MTLFSLAPQKTALLIVDMQDKVFAAVDRGQETLNTIIKVIKGFEILNIPMYISEQYPQGLGTTLLPIKTLLGPHYQPIVKDTFSCIGNANFHPLIENHSQFVVVGIEAHICILQTVKSLILAGKQVAVLNDAITSRSIFDYSTAIAEMRDNGARITSSETILFELLGNCKRAEFKPISQLIKTSSC